MDYPLLLKGEIRGKLTVEKQGLYTIIEAGAEKSQGLVRLWVQGQGEQAYLGVMEPKNGGLYLRRRLSRLEMSAFPQKIEQASDSSLKDEVYITRNSRDYSAETANDRGAEKQSVAAEAEEKGAEAEEKGAEAPALAEETAGAESEAEAKEALIENGSEEKNQPPPGKASGQGELPAAETLETGGKRGEECRTGGCSSWEAGAGHGEETGLLWTARRDGSLIARKGDHYLVALPANLRSVPPGARLKRIGEKEYLLFVY